MRSWQKSVDLPSAKALTSPAMDAELSLLEERLAELIDAYQSLRMENRDLTARVGVLQIENKRYAEKLAQASKQVEHILARLPEEG